MSSRDFLFRALFIPVSIIYGSPAGSRVTLMFLCSNSARNRDPQGSICQNKAAPGPELLTVRPLFPVVVAWQRLLGSLLFTSLNASGSKPLPFAGWMREMCCLAGSCKPLPHWSQMAGPDPRAGWRTCTAKAFTERFITSKCTFVTGNFKNIHAETPP